MKSNNQNTYFNATVKRGDGPKATFYNIDGGLEGKSVLVITGATKEIMK
jgi:hypothetical protein